MEIVIWEHMLDFGKFLHGIHLVGFSESPFGVEANDYQF